MAREQNVVGAAARTKIAHTEPLRTLLLIVLYSSNSAPYAPHLLNNEPHNEGISHCESSLFNNEGICLREQ